MCVCVCIMCKVGRSKPPPVLTGGFNWLNRPGQYAKNWSLLVNTNLSGRLKILRGCFRGRLRYKVRIYALFIKKKYCFVPAKGTFHLSTVLFITVQAPNTLYSF